MPKFYIYSGDLQEVVQADDYKQALIKTFSVKPDDNMMLSSCVFVSEKGFMFDNSLGGTEDDINRHRKNACKMIEFSDDFILPHDSDLLLKTELILDIVKKGME